MWGLTPTRIVYECVKNRTFLKLISGVAKESVNNDKNRQVLHDIEFIDDALQEANRTHSAIDILYNLVRRLLPSKKRQYKTTRVMNNEGNPASSITEEKGLFRDHFSTLLGGTACKFIDLLEKNGKRWETHSI